VNPSTTARRGRLAAALAGAAALCLGAGAHLLTSPASADVADAGDVPDPGPAATALPAADEAQVPHGGPARPGARATTAPRRVASAPPVLLPPTRLRVPALRVDPRVVPVAVDSDGALELPDDPAVLGWWAGGADPGAGAGTVVLAGHIDTKEAGPGVMARVVDVPVGAGLELSDAHGARVAYTVVAVRTYGKDDLPASIFARSGRERLVLVTCGGPFDSRTHHYSDNIVVYAVPTPR
jgi:hypothetical protein